MTPYLPTCTRAPAGASPDKAGAVRVLSGSSSTMVISNDSSGEAGVLGGEVGGRCQDDGGRAGEPEETADHLLQQAAVKRPVRADEPVLPGAVAGGADGAYAQGGLGLDAAPVLSDSQREERAALGPPVSERDR